ncbi:uncharacterized protein LOC130911752 [Corythoichthys intestinalis]|uniref:uncharacterized protein LOC130910190 n=1 Tax=Corythoichthys intestinalis TaxID=161448 RepID=UPI0025A643A3|nr:uncharacterized protein LOC130910190 [Corythoichthys intestinalis]XP_057685274.1 uncharacterized protein LOC130911752 [Corythoichthys intestinalis]
MGMYCCVPGCDSVSHYKNGLRKSGYSFHNFPAWRTNRGQQISEITKARRMAWVAAVRRKNISFDHISPGMKVCSRHFASGKPASEMQTTHPDWAPSLFLDGPEVKRITSARYKRLRWRRVFAVTSAVKDQLSAVPLQAEQAMQTMDKGAVHDDGDVAEEELLQAEQAMQTMDKGAVHDDGDVAEEESTDETVAECDLCQPRLEEINRLMEENRRLNKELEKRAMGEEFLKDDTKVEYYTGLPDMEVLMGLLSCILPRLSTPTGTLSPFQMLFLTLMHLKLNLPLQHIAHLFNVNGKTASEAFSEMIDVLHATISPLVIWPSREILHATMPYQFVEAFGRRVAVILDCFEIFTQKPSNLKAQAQSYSHYRQSNSMKYLIGVTPQGAISFISKGCGGGASDKHITETSGILDKLLPGDMVLADRGFDIQDSVGLMCAEVKIPAFTQGRSQLDASDVESTRKIAHLRIHVERVIGNIRNKYTILSNKVPISFVLPCKREDVTFLDKLVVVCCALTNMSTSVVVKIQ